jgi:dTDP-4-amino-4,6-dideoxygalactose transaminase
LKNFGITVKETVESVGGNAKMNEFQAAMGICNLRYIDEEIEKRKRVVERYINLLDNGKGIKLLKSQKGIKSNYTYFPVIFDGFNKIRDELYEELIDKNIFTRKYFYPITNSFECYQGRFNPDETTIAKYVAERVLTLPLYADLALDDVDRIAKIILDKV